MVESTERISMNISKSDKTALRLLAELEGETMSVLIRRILRKELEIRGLFNRELDTSKNLSDSNYQKSYERGDENDY